MYAKALSIRHPWLELILLGRKTLEIRSWPTSYRGPIYLHCPITIDPFDRVGAHMGDHDELISLMTPDSFMADVGNVVGSVEVVDCIELTGSADQDSQACGKTYAGQFGFQLAHAKRVTPFQVRGKLGLFDVHMPASAWRS